VSFVIDDYGKREYYPFPGGVHPDSAEEVEEFVDRYLKGGLVAKRKSQVITNNTRTHPNVQIVVADSLQKQVFRANEYFHLIVLAHTN
jgi:ethanolamine ammonia-lyase small subunit